MKTLTEKGSAELIVATNLKTLEIGEEYASDWEINWVDNSTTTQTGNVDKTKFAGIALKYTEDIETDDLEDEDDKVNVGVYDGLYLTRTSAKDKDVELKFGISREKDMTLEVSKSDEALNAKVKLKDIKATAQKAVEVKAPIAKLDSEITSLDKADKNLILVGGPLVNALTKELVGDEIDNESPAILKVVEGAANNNDVLIVAGGDRKKTKEAALALLEGDY